MAVDDYVMMMRITARLYIIFHCSFVYNISLVVMENYVKSFLSVDFLTEDDLSLE